MKWNTPKKSIYPNVLLPLSHLKHHNLQSKPLTRAHLHPTHKFQPKTLSQPTQNPHITYNPPQSPHASFTFYNNNNSVYFFVINFIIFIRSTYFFFYLFCQNTFFIFNNDFLVYYLFMKTLWHILRSRNHNSQVCAFLYTPSMHESLTFAIWTTIHWTSAGVILIINIHCILYILTVFG